MKARRGIGGEPYRRFVAQGIQRQDAGLFDYLEQGQGKVTGDAENLFHPVSLQGLE